jgi:quinol monooxygenase YgiN
MVTVVGKIAAKTGTIEKVKSQLMNLVEPSRGENGCFRYSLYQDIDDPAVLVVYENWESRNALDVHMSTAHFKECFSAIEGLYDVEVHILSELS